jgi:predicted metal-dependent peptidase
MNNNLTSIVILLDRSGSMGCVRQDTVGGFDTFIEDQKKLAGDVEVTLVQFDHEYEYLYKAVPLSEVRSIDPTYQPRGSTALLNSLGRLIDETGKRLAETPETKRPEKVLFIILTDGEDNQYSSYSREKLAEMIARQRDVYKWDFVFLGANQDAILSAASIGISAGKAMSYANNSVGTQSLFRSVSN